MITPPSGPGLAIRGGADGNVHIAADMSPDFHDRARQNSQLTLMYRAPLNVGFLYINIATAFDNTPAAAPLPTQSTSSRSSTPSTPLRGAQPEHPASLRVRAQ